MNKPILAALVAAGMLSACGGGGGGGGGGTRPSDTVPVSQEAAPATGDTATLDPLGQIPASDHHIDFTLQSDLTPAPLGSSDALNGTVTPEVYLSNAPSIRVVIRDPVSGDVVSDDLFPAEITKITSAFFNIGTASLDNSDGTTRHTVTYIVPDSGGSNAFKLQFSSLGVWNTSDIATGTITQSVAFSVGTRTEGSDIPTTGTASYFGYMLGTATEGSSQYSVGANASAFANFGTRSVAYQTQNSVKTDVRDPNGVATAAGNYDMRGTLGYLPASNDLSGVVTTADGKTGTATGSFYGPKAAELGMTFKLVDPNAPASTLVGGAALKR